MGTVPFPNMQLYIPKRKHRFFCIKAENQHFLLTALKHCSLPSHTGDATASQTMPRQEYFKLREAGVAWPVPPSWGTHSSCATTPRVAAPSPARFLAPKYLATQKANTICSRGRGGDVIFMHPFAVCGPASGSEQR